MLRPAHVLVIWLVILSLSIGCGKTEPLPDVNGGGGGSGSKAPSSSTPATEAEAAEFGQRLEAAFAANNFAELDELIDWESLAKRSARGLGSAEMQREIVTGMLSTLQGANGFFSNIRRAGGESAAYDYLRTTKGDDRLRVWFRMSGEGGVNYHDFLVVNQGGRIRAIDIYVLMSGEFSSETSRRAMLPVISETSKNWLEKLTSAESEYVKNFRTVEQVIASMQRGDPQGALAAYRRLPEGVKTEKNMLNFRYQAASQLGDFDEVITAATAMKENYPDDPCLDLLMIDTYVLQEKYDEALECIDRVAVVVGGDPMLAGMKGGILIAAKRFDEAKQVVEQAIADEPDLIDNYWQMVALGLETRDHALTYDYLKRIDSQFEITWHDIRQQEEYAEFVTSPEGRQWLSEKGL